MKLNLLFLLVLLSVALGYFTDNERESLCSHVAVWHDTATCTSQAANTMEWMAEYNSPTYPSTTLSIARNTLTKRHHTLNYSAKSKRAIAEVHITNYNCSSYYFALLQHPRRGLFFILRNIRI